MIAAVALLVVGSAATLARAVLGVAIALAAIAAITASQRRAAVRRRVRSGDLARPGPLGRRPSPLAATVAAGSELASGLGRVLRRVGGRSPDPQADLRLGRAAMVALAAMTCGVGSLLALVLGFAVWAAPLAVRTSRRSRHRAAIADETPEVVDLIRLGIGSGLNVRLALDAVVRHHDGLIAAELREVLALADRGARLADALDTVHPGSDAVRPLVDALVASERYGAPLASALDLVAADARTARRRQREAAARRVPVKLLFPLVFCTLPAFVLLTVVPVLLRSLPSLAP